MKNIQVIDDADNCKYPVYSATDAEFDLIFPDGRDVEFIEDFVRRVKSKLSRNITEEIWRRPVDKSIVIGIHGTLFYGLKKQKAKYYPNRKFSDDKYG